MPTATAAPSDRALTAPRVIAVLAAIVVLALVLPYGAVHTLHVRRLETADHTARAIADRLSAALHASPSETPPAASVLAGPGDQPRAIDERWSTAARFPLARVLGGAPAIPPDPWGNAYLVNVGADPRRPLWVISAGPDGILQTPLADAGDRASGDDRTALIR